ncbi:class 1 isoprenoid biosynthesis enzyme [Pseudoflavitalea rhizosphaerae]|uniref:class 1 isoprenoid biosynthesis enzyme n=1 Tax=Pseudoflavitalea rhizosphaerae TaxID=1884793 RepID=UPI000F8CDD6F|nr:class 1 isoprenoid biosynthesis enzyme [Pseudoflavitalea rhizosphaerae]
MQIHLQEASRLPGTVSLPNTSLLAVARHMFSLHRQMKLQEQKCKEEIPELIAAIIPPDQFSFSSKDILRITKYYQLALNLVCDNVYQLAGKELNTREHRNILLLSVFLPLFDDLFDDRLLNYPQIEALINDPEVYTPANTIDSIVQNLYVQLLREIPAPDRFTQYLKEVAYWELQSLKQFNREIPEEELTQITYNKSFYSILLFCSVLEFDPGAAMNALLYPVSGLMQLTNDVFDVWKDLQKSLYTIPNLYWNYEKLKTMFLNEINSINNQVAQMTYPESNRKNFLIRTHALNAMGWMSLQQLREVAVQKPFSEASRKELVCDMDSLPRQLRWVGYVRQLCNTGKK